MVAHQCLNDSAGFADALDQANARGKPEVTTKPPDGYCFPHRTFQEFLVTERLYETAVAADSEMFGIGFLSSEVVSFFVELIGRREVSAWRERVKHLKVFLSEPFAELLALSCKQFDGEVPEPCIATPSIPREREVELNRRLLQEIITQTPHKPAEGRSTTRRPHFGGQTGKVAKGKYRHLHGTD